MAQNIFMPPQLEAGDRVRFVSLQLAMRTNEAKYNDNVTLYGVKRPDIAVDVDTPIAEVPSLQRMVPEANVKRIRPK